MVWVKDHDREKVDAIAEDLENELRGNLTVSKSYVDTDNNANVLKIIDILFYVTIGIMMFLCFFSLVASMTANIYD